MQTATITISAVAMRYVNVLAAVNASPSDFY